MLARQTMLFLAQQVVQSLVLLVQLLARASRGDQRHHLRRVSACAPAPSRAMASMSPCMPSCLASSSSSRSCSCRSCCRIMSFSACSAPDAGTGLSSGMQPSPSPPATPCPVWHWRTDAPAALTGRNTSGDGAAGAAVGSARMVHVSEASRTTATECSSTTCVYSLRCVSRYVARSGSTPDGHLLLDG